MQSLADVSNSVELTTSAAFTLDPNTEIDDGSQPEKKVQVDDENSSEYSFTQLSDKQGSSVKKLAYQKFNNATFYNKIKKGSKYPYESSPEVDEYLMWVNDNKDKLGWSPNPCRFSKNHTMYKKDVCESKP